VHRLFHAISTGAPQWRVEILEHHGILNDIHELALQELLMGAPTTIPPKMINATAPDGLPSR